MLIMQFPDVAKTGLSNLLNKKGKAMRYTRRAFFNSGALGLAALGGAFQVKAQGKELGKTASERRLRGGGPPPYKIIYNWDGAPHDYSEYPQLVDQFLQKTYAPMKDTQVGAHFWCIGEHEAKWPSKTMELVGDLQNRRYDSVRSMRHVEGVRAMFERGEDPYQGMVKRGNELGMHVYASVRMNDNHFSGLQLEEFPTTVTEGITKLRREHPEWCLGPKRAPKWFAASWNFAIPEVREHRFQHVAEVCRLAQWDGIELDWQRHGFHLPLDDAYRLRYTLTDLQRAIRQMTNQLGKERGRPFYVAVRVATTLESCRRIGYDLETWAKEGLCDIITAGGGAGTDYGIEVEKFVDLLKGSGIQFYTGFDGGFWGEHKGLGPEKQWNEALVRGSAKGYWDRGADGMYVFNWHANERTRRPLLTTIGSTETLKRTNKVYMSLHRYVGGFPFSEPKEGQWAGADFHDRIYGETPVQLYRTLTGEGPKFHVSVYDDLQQDAREGALKGAELHIELEHFSPSDEVELKLDGTQLTKPAIRNVAGESGEDPSDVDENSWLVWSLKPEQAARGSHEIQVRLLKRNARLRVDLVVRSVEIHLKYS